MGCSFEAIKNFCATRTIGCCPRADLGTPSQDDPLLSYLHYPCVVRTGPVVQENGPS